MQNSVLMAATAAFVLVCGATAASAQQGPTMQPQAQTQQQQERPLQRTQGPRRGVDDDIDDDWDDDSGITGWNEERGWRHNRDWHHRGMGFGMMGREASMMGPWSMHSGMMMRMLFAMMDPDGDGTVSLQEFQAAHERIFKAMDANKDGVLTLEEIQASMRGTRTPARRQ